MPSRLRLNRLLRRHREAITAFALRVGRDVASDDRAFEVLDGTGVRVRAAFGSPVCDHLANPQGDS